MSQSRPLFVYFCSFLIIISIIQSEKSLNGVLSIWTRSRRMVGADKTMELGRLPQTKIVCWYFWQIFIIFSEYLTLWSAFSAQTNGCLILLSFISFVVQTFSAVTSPVERTNKHKNENENEQQKPRKGLRLSFHLILLDDWLPTRASLLVN